MRGTVHSGLCNGSCLVAHTDVKKLTADSAILLFVYQAR